MNSIIVAILFIFSGMFLMMYSLKNNARNIRELSKEKDIGGSIYLRFIIGGIGSIIFGVFIIYKEFFDGGFNW